MFYNVKYPKMFFDHIWFDHDLHHLASKSDYFICAPNSTKVVNLVKLPKVVYEIS